jgi:hypothetical protein
VRLQLSQTVAELIESQGRPECGLWLRVRGQEASKQRRWLEPEMTLLECGIDACHVLRCEPRPRSVTFECAGKTYAMEVMEQDSVELVERKAAQTAATGGKELRLHRKGRQCALFGWASLAQQGVPAAETLELRAVDVPLVYLSAAEPPFINEDPNLEADVFWETDKTGQGQHLLEAASLNGLVALMTGSSTGSSVQQIQMILLTHASFTTSAQLLRLLIQRGRHRKQSDVVIRVLKVLKQWFDVDHFLPDAIVENIAVYLARDIVPLDLKARQEKR